MVLRSHLPDLAIPDKSLHDYLLQCLQAHGDRVAVLNAGDNKESFTFKQIRDCAVKCACALYDLGIGKGDIIATCMTNCVEYVFVMIGASACGAAVTTCNPSYTEVEIIRQFQNSQPKMVFVDACDYNKMVKVSHSVGSIKDIISAERTSICKTIYDLIDGAVEKNFPYQVEVNPDDTVMMPYSSGTTGLSKGVMITQRNLVSIIELGRVSVGNSRADTQYLVLPMFHIYGGMVTLLSLVTGSKTILEKRFTVDSFFHSVQEHKINFLYAVPPMILSICNSPQLSHYDISSLSRIISGAAPLPDGVAKQVMKKLNVRLYQGWGLTEAVPLVVSSLDVNIPIQSVGYASPNTLIKVTDPNTGKELGSYKEGEICVKGPQVMKGYYKAEAATKRSFDSDGWFRTGDIGYYDKYEYLFVVDRLKELIKYKGFQVAPAELEELLLRHPKISDVAVIGVPDIEAGEVPKAFVVATDPHLSKIDIHAFVNGKVSSYKQLRGGIEFRSFIPKSASGKILRRELRDEERRKSKL
ncbi:uncharacterized protein LOC143469450 [Clavelina lepadiformis]|uniref:uncharacterized protein LOC143469450 n=1 Tax=Clavelina lepadiformis TaxID=159417 RepID=UPI0040431AA8